jgi:glyoxylase I family protein
MEGNRTAGGDMNSITTAIQGFHHAALKARDFSASLKFYQEGLGFIPKIAWGQGDGRAVMLEAGNGNFLELFAGGAARAPRPAGSPGEPEPPLLHLAFRAPSCDAALERARKAGAVVIAEPKTVTIPSTPPTTVRIAFCLGPDGETIEFFQERA